ncbi:MAG: transcriptional regulator, MerR family-like protein [Proteobacteria bacterium]|nr:transcriptional regulator, MerR family-like protein [Pseudomonadota bacterium]
MNIGQAARLSGVSSKRIRHYESIGLLQPARRTGANYRSYSERDVHVLRFINRARELGFGIDPIRELLSLWSNRRRSSAAVRSLAARHLEDIDGRIAGLEEVAKTLRTLVKQCQGDDRPDCPILGALEHP